MLPSGGGFCSPGRSVEAGLSGLPHSCRMIRRRPRRMPFGDRIGVLVLGSKEMRCLCIRMSFPPTSPGRSVQVGMVSLPHFCRVIRLRALPGCDLEPGWASKCSEAGKCGACAAEWGPRHLPGAGIFMGEWGSNPIPADGSGAPGAGLPLQGSRTPSGGYNIEAPAGARVHSQNSLSCN